MPNTLTRHAGQFDSGLTSGFGAGGLTREETSQRVRLYAAHAATTPPSANTNRTARSSSVRATHTATKAVTAQKAVHAMQTARSSNRMSPIVPRSENGEKVNRPTAGH